MGFRDPRLAAARNKQRIKGLICTHTYIYIRIHVYTRTATALYIYTGIGKWQATTEREKNRYARLYYTYVQRQTAAVIGDEAMTTRPSKRGRVREEYFSFVCPSCARPSVRRVHRKPRFSDFAITVEEKKNTAADTPRDSPNGRARFYPTTILLLFSRFFGFFFAFFLFFFVFVPLHMCAAPDELQKVELLMLLLLLLLLLMRRNTHTYARIISVLLEEHDTPTGFFFFLPKYFFYAIQTPTRVFLKRS